MRKRRRLRRGLSSVTRARSTCLDRYRQPASPHSSASHALHRTCMCARCTGVRSCTPAHGVSRTPILTTKEQENTKSSDGLTQFPVHGETQGGLASQSQGLLPFPRIGLGLHSLERVWRRRDRSDIAPPVPMEVSDLSDDRRRPTGEMQGTSSGVVLGSDGTTGRQRASGNGQHRVLRQLGLKVAAMRGIELSLGHLLLGHHI